MLSLNKSVFSTIKTSKIILDICCNCRKIVRVQSCLLSLNVCCSSKGPHNLVRASSRASMFLSYSTDQNIERWWMFKGSTLMLFKKKISQSHGCFRGPFKKFYNIKLYKMPHWEKSKVSPKQRALKCYCRTNKDRTNKADFQIFQSTFENSRNRK